MKDIYIKYNPYKVETVIEIDGWRADKHGGLFYALDGHRLQEWIEPRQTSNWDGIFKALKRQTNAQDIRISFHGTVFDYEDLQYAKERYGGVFESVDLVHENAEESGQYDQAEKLQALRRLYQELQDGPIEEFKSEDIRAAFESAIGSDFEIVVIAPMSSGKSTLINAILGQDILPAMNQATTAVITRIRDNDSFSRFLVTAKDGEGNTVRCVLDEDGTYHIGMEGEPVENIAASAGLISALNSTIDPADPEKKRALVNTTYIEGQIEALPSDRISAVFVDTPGGNNSANKHHQDIMDEAIRDENKSMILYVFNGTQTGTNDSDAILEQIAEEMKRSRNGKQSRDRFLFVANRMDDFDPEKEDYQGYIKNSILPGLEKYGITEPQLFLVSAQLAKLSRMKRQGYPLTKQERTWLSGKEQLFGDTVDFDPAYRLYRYSAVSDRVKADFDRQLEVLRGSDPDAEWNSEIAEINSGVPALESAIRDYVEKYAVCIKINDAHERFMGKVRDRATMDEYQARLVSSTMELDRVRAEIEKKQKSIEDDKMAEAFIDKIQAITFDKSKLYQRTASLNAALDRLRDRLKENSGSEIRKTEAMVSLRDFKRRADIELEKAGEDCEKLLNSGIISQCNEILREYTEYIRTLRDQGFLELGGLKIDAFSDFRRFKVKDAEDMLARGDYTYTTGVKTGERRVKTSGLLAKGRRLLGRIFGQSWGYETESIYEDVEMLKIDSLLKDKVTEVMTEFTLAVRSAIDETEEQIKDVKASAADKVADLKQHLLDAMSSIKEMTSDQEKLQQRVNNNESELKWMKDYIARVDSILEV